MEHVKHRDRLRDQQSLIASSHDLLAREREIDLDWQRAIADCFSQRSGQGGGRDLWSQVLAGAIMGVVRSTVNYWHEGNCEDDLTQLGLAALEFVEQGFPHSIE